jgi:hypothetical protein
MSRITKSGSPLDAARRVPSVEFADPTDRPSAATLRSSRLPRFTWSTRESAIRLEC